MMAPQPDVRLAAAYLTRYNRLRNRTVTAVGFLWDRHANLDDRAAAVFAGQAASVVRGSQAGVTALVNGHLGAAATLVDSGVLDLDDTPPTPRNVDLDEVYYRGVVSARAAISEGRTYTEAMTAGRARAVASASTDVVLAQRAVMSRAVDGTRIVGYRRTLTGVSCALCASASTQRYTRSSLMPIHSHCDCGVAPIIGSRDPGHVINEPLLADLKSAGKATGDPDYWRSRKFKVDEDGTIRLPGIAIHHHGELGPVLTDADHNFTGPSDLAA